MTIISIISAKGGVGKTTLTANLGVIFAEEFGKRVLLVDGNITTPTLGLQLGILSQQNTLTEVLNDNLSIYQAIYMHPCGLHLIPASLAIDQKYENIEFLKDKLLGVKDSYDIILIDGAAGIGKEVISALKSSDSAIIVSNPEIASITAAIKAVKIARALNVQVLGLILNRVERKSYELKIGEIEDLTETKVMGIVPYDRRIQESARHMTPIALYKRRSISRAAFKILAGRIANEPVKETVLSRVKEYLVPFGK